MTAVFRALRYILLGACLAGLLFAGGFVYFTTMIARDASVSLPAEGIVALTGGKARIGQAVRLLIQGQARRLLITGVHPSTKAIELQRLVPGGAKVFPCCVDLGRIARDTRGNAAETRAWAAKNDFSTLIVVTSSYHMPRALVEFGRAMPKVHFVPHVVISSNFKIEAWWSHTGTRRLLFFEYVKYLNALTGYTGARLAAASAN